MRGSAERTSIDNVTPPPLSSAVAAPAPAARLLQLPGGWPPAPPPHPRRGGARPLRQGAPPRRPNAASRRLRRGPHPNRVRPLRREDGRALNLRSKPAARRPYAKEPVNCLDRSDRYRTPIGSQARLQLGTMWSPSLRWTSRERLGEGRLRPLGQVGVARPTRNPEGCNTKS